MRAVIAILTLMIAVSFAAAAQDRIELKNGDVVSGEIIRETESFISIMTDAMGTVTIDRFFLKPEPQEITAVETRWERALSLGYGRESGNTESSEFAGEIRAHRKTDNDEAELKADVYYSSSDKQMDSQTWYAMARYGKSFGEDKKWYFFEKLEADHDKFTNINYRLVPSVGVGYWFSDTEQWKALAECGLGYEHTDHTDNSRDSNALILVPRAFFEKKLWGDSFFSQDITFYPSLEDAGEYRIHSESSFVNPIDDTLSLEFSLIDDYNADPPPGIKKNDIKFISALTCSF